MQGWGQQFRINEILSLLEAISTHLPIGSLEWEVVASQHNENFPDKERTGPSLRRNFSQLHKVKKPTGDPTCPVEVRYAKQIFRRIEQGADASAEIEFNYCFKHDFNAANNAKPKSNLNSRCHQCTTNFVCLNSMSNTKKQQW